MKALKQPELNGCHNREPLKKTLLGQDGWAEDGRRIMKEIPFAMSTDCKHDKRDTDPRCAGCCWIAQAGAAPGQRMKHDH